MGPKKRIALIAHDNRQHELERAPELMTYQALRPDFRFASPVFEPARTPID